MNKISDIDVLLFDVNETLVDITILEPFFLRVFKNPLVLRSWFAELVLYSQTMTASGLYEPFGNLAVGVLRMSEAITILRSPATMSQSLNLYSAICRRTLM